MRNAIILLCFALATWAQPLVSGGGGVASMSTGASDPAANCAAPTASALALYTQTTSQDLWACVATNTWKKLLSTAGTGPYVVTGATGTAPSNPASGYVSCYLDSTLNMWVCLDSSGNASQMVKQTTLAAMRLEVCSMAFGDTSASAALTDAQLGPQVGMCIVPAAATVTEIDVRADGGTPNIVVGVDHAGSVSNLLSAALATGSSGAWACSKSAAVAGLRGATCSATLQNAALAAGDSIQAVSGTAGGTAKLVTVNVIYQY